MIGFFKPSEDSKEALYRFVVSVDSIEALTGIDFFPELEDGLEDRFDEQNDYKGWRFN